VSICLVIVLKCVAIMALSPSRKNEALLLMPVMGRWAQVLLAYSADYAGLKRGLGSAFTEQVTVLTLIIAAVLAGIIATALLGGMGLILVCFVGLFMLLYNSFFKRTFGGVTGDILGAATEMTEVVSLLVLLIRI